MCGILVFVGNRALGNRAWTRLSQSIKNRGPDFYQELVLELGSGLRLWLASSVLFIRKPTRQPLLGRGILLWNGEIFGGLDILDTENDGQVLLGELDKTVSDHELLCVLSRIRGPYAFVYYRHDTNSLWFGRDMFGRRSLMSSQKDGMVLSSSSVLGDMEFEEISGIHKLMFTNMSWMIYAWGSKWLCSPVSRLELVIKDPVSELLTLLDRAVRKRVEGIETLGILFSGGLDSTILARMADQHFPKDKEIDLFNVAWSGSPSAPDRMAGREVYRDLSKLSNRTWNFIEIDISNKELDKHREHILSLMQPSDTVMDFSIAVPLWFCARGMGKMGGIPYTTRTKVLITGFGADELFGGYSRYRNKYLSGGLQAAEHEMQNDFDRIWKRNMGRDDRCLSDHGKEARFPYLDEDLATFAISLPSCHKFDFDIPMGDKLILRRAALKLNLDFVAKRQKRAIQFGSRTSKIVQGSSGTALIDPKLDKILSQESFSTPSKPFRLDFSLAEKRVQHSSDQQCVDLDKKLVDVALIRDGVKQNEPKS